MNTFTYLLVLLVISSCTTIDQSIFANKVFRTDSHHMVGSSSIEFESDTLFRLTERDGSLYSEGTWKVEDDEIILDSFERTRQKDSSAIYFNTTKHNIKIKSKKKTDF